MLNAQELSNKRKKFENLLASIAADDKAFIEFVVNCFNDFGFDCYCCSEGNMELWEDYGIVMEGGASRVVIIADNDNYVLKLNYDNVEEDYCKIEYDNYLAAKEEKLDFCFGECYYTEINFRIPVADTNETELVHLTGCFMEKMECNPEIVSDKSYEIRLKQSGLSEEEFNSNRKWMSGTDVASVVIRHEFGQEIYDKLTELYTRLQINDIHCGNIGWDIHGKLKLSDYAGFFE